VERVQKPGYISDGVGLYLQISPSVTKSWVFRYRLHGKLREFGVGPFPPISLKQARAAAIASKQARLRGEDTIDEKRKRKAQAAAQCAESYTFSA
jgi:hypothetical protein